MSAQHQKMRSSFLLFPVLLLSLTGFSSAQEGSVAFRVGTLITMDGSTHSPGTVVVEQGRITAIGGADLEIPFDVLLKEYPDATLFPGFAETHTSGGLDRANENVPVAPFLDVKDSIDPVSYFFEDELRLGTTALGIIPGANCVIGGRGRVVAPAGMTMEAMTLDDSMGMKIAIGPKSGWSRSAQMAELREAVSKLNRDLRTKAQDILHHGAVKADALKADEAGEDSEEDGDMWDSSGGYVRFGEDFPGKDLLSEEDVDETQRGLVDILNGDERLWLWCPTATDVFHGKTWAEDLGLLDHIIFVVTASAWKAADLLMESGRPVTLTGSMWHVERDPVTWEEVRTFVPTVFHEAGLAFSLGSEKSRMGPHRLGYQAATCIREGLPRAVALAAVTTNPAAMWGMEDQVGALKVNADGTFVLMDGDPLDIQSKVLQVWIRGSKAYDRNTDERLQRLLKGQSR